MDSITVDMLGTALSITTSEGEVIKGELFSYENGCVALVQPPSDAKDPHRFTFRIVSTSTVNKVEVHAPASASALLRQIGNLDSGLDLEKIRKNETKQLNVAHDAARRINKNATPFAQHVFNKLSLSYPCKWEDTVIVVFNGEIKIDPPYDKCVATQKQGNKETLEHLNRALQGIRARVSKEMGGS